VAAPRLFLFGKLPAHGDFVARGLPDHGRHAWDERATTLVDTARTRLGEQFEDAYDASPPWRFVCGPSSLGQDWRAGAMAPSVDSAGRRFFVAVGVDGLSAEAARTDGERVAEQSEAAIYEALAGGATADDVLKSAYPILAGLSQNGGGEAASSPGRWWTVDEAGATAMSVAADEPPADLLLRTLDALHLETAP
jgi:type VI secretion system protein ImpM